MKKLGKYLEWKWREIRSFFQISNHQCYKSLLEQYLRKSTSSSKKVLFDLTDIKIDNVGGRYFYYIAHDFASAGYDLYFKNRFRFIANIKTKGFKSHLLELPFNIYTSESEVISGDEEFIVVSDCQKTLDSSQGAKKVLIDYAMRRADPTKNEIALPFSMSPTILSKGIKPPKINLNAKRPIKFLFAGNLDPKVYGTKTMPEKYGMMNRIQVIEEVKKQAKKDDLICPQDQLPFEEITKERNIVILDTRYCKVPPERWLEFLSHAEYFIAAPGEGMPLCHNLIEAMSVGCVPILEYGEYLTPPLIDEENAVFFDDLNKRSVDIFSSSKVGNMKNEVLNYFGRTLEPSSFSKNIFKTSSKVHQVNLLLNDYRIFR